MEPVPYTVSAAGLHDAAAALALGSETLIAFTVDPWQEGPVQTA